MTAKQEKQTDDTAFWTDYPGNGLADVSSKVKFPALDKHVLKFWEDNQIFQRTISEREGGPDFIAYDGPPGTNGVPHIGHLMQSALKDLWPRYYTMKGYRVLRKAGWDTHGLPVELTAEKELGLHSKRDIIEYGVEKYIDYCRKTVYRYKDAWTNAIIRSGRFLDTDNYYATLTTDYIQTDWWVLKQAWDKGLLYQGHKVMPHCTRCGTSLSSHETAQGYVDITDISLYVKFPVAGKKDTFFIAWTTTAWTLLSNVALAVNPDLLYVSVKSGNETYILAKDRLETLKDKLGDYQIIDEKPGSELKGVKYIPLWDFLADAGENAHQVVADDYVTAEDGSGIVHLALYGEDDFRIIKKNDIPMVQNVNLEGIVSQSVKPFAGRWFREEGLDIDILKNLLGKGLLLGKVKIVHSYPHCYRCDTPLMYFAKSAWFLKTSAIKEQMLKANQEINWYPDHIKNGRFGNWLENNVDWNISRERYWGSPLPIWTCQDCGEQICVGSLKELGEQRGEALPEDFDPHKPDIDKIELECKKCSGKMVHEPEVLDPWFNAGIMPWGQWGYPAAKGSIEKLEAQYPADFICEAIDQTRGWFYTLLATSTLLTGKSSYKNVICTDHILDEQGLKMSKSRGNVVEPVGQCDKFGGDAVRWIFFVMNPWTVRRYREDDVMDALKQILIPLWNSYSFFVTYAKVDGWKPEAGADDSKRLLDKWILSRLEWLREDVEAALTGYDVARASSSITTYVDELTNWYIRRSRRRFWKSEDDNDKRDAYNTLYDVLCNLNRILAPFLPFMTEVVYQNLERGFDDSVADSVHLSEFPAARPQARDTELELVMDQTRKIVSLGRALRNEGGLRVRQPLSEVVVAGEMTDPGTDYADLICDELNVKRLRFTTDVRDLYHQRAKANFKILGPRFGGRIKEIAGKISELSDASVAALSANGFVDVGADKIHKDEVEISIEAMDGFWVRGDGGITVAINYQLTDELYSEWLAREFVHHVQNMRKTADLNVTDRIVITFSGTDKLRSSINQNGDYIRSETLASDIRESNELVDEENLKTGDQNGRIKIEKI